MSRNTFILAVAITALIGLANPSTTQADEPMSDERRQEIEALIGEYLMQNPEVVIDAITVYRERQEALERDRVASTINELKSAIDDNPMLPVIGNPQGSVTIVEFFDYQCGYCKSVLGALQGVIDGNDDVRVVMMEFPILGDESVVAARAALATWLTWPETYAEYHAALMSSRGRMSEDVVFGEATALGIDADALRTAMEAPEIDAAVRANYEVAGHLSINGTPAFIIGDELIPGAISQDEMEQRIAAVRKN